MDLERLLALTYKQMNLFSQQYYTCQELEQEYEKLSEKYSSYPLKKIGQNFLQMAQKLAELDDENFQIISDLKVIYDLEIAEKIQQQRLNPDENEGGSGLDQDGGQINGVSEIKKENPKLIQKDYNKGILKLSKVKSSISNGAQTTYQSYDQDIKVKAMQMLESGEKLQTVSKKYNIPPATIYYWQNQGKQKSGKEGSNDKRFNKERDIDEDGSNINSNQLNYDEDNQETVKESKLENGEIDKNAQEQNNYQMQEGNGMSRKNSINKDKSNVNKRKSSVSSNGKVGKKLQKKGKKGVKGKKEEKNGKKKTKKKTKKSGKGSSQIHQQGVQVDKKYEKYYTKRNRAKPQELDDEILDCEYLVQKKIKINNSSENDNEQNNKQDNQNLIEEGNEQQTRSNSNSILQDDSVKSTVQKNNDIKDISEQKQDGN